MAKPVSSPPIKFGSRTTLDSEANSLLKNEIYKVSSDGFVTFTHQQGNQGLLYFFTDANNPPTTEIGILHGDWGNGYWIGCIPVRKNDYWKIYYAGAGSVNDIRWLPLGHGACIKQ